MKLILKIEVECETDPLLNPDRIIIHLPFKAHCQEIQLNQNLISVEKEAKGSTPEIVSRFKWALPEWGGGSQRLPGWFGALI